MFPTERYIGLAATPLPLPIRRTKYFALNLYCGRRQPDDIHGRVEQSHYLTGVAIIVLSMDIAIDPALGSPPRPLFAPLA